MNSTIQTTILETAKASNAGHLHFGQVLEQLMQVGVEAYHVDYRARRSTYYLPDGETLTVDLEDVSADIPPQLDVAALKAVIRRAQQGEVMYPEFKRLSQAAGCASYSVWISGRHVAYFGRDGQTHVERFPD